jgi:hypothetical protein
MLPHDRCAINVGHCLFTTIAEMASLVIMLPADDIDCRHLFLERRRGRDRCRQSTEVNRFTAGVVVN